MLNASLVTPDSILFEGEASYLALPGSEGSFGVLPDHAPFLGKLQPGKVSVHTKDKVIEYYVESGFAEVRANNVTVLLEGFIDPDKIDVEAENRALAEIDMSPIGGDAKIEERFEKQQLHRYKIALADSLKK